MIIVTYCNSSYKPCLDKTLPTWQADKILIYTDSEEFGIKIFDHIFDEDFDTACRRKIEAIQRAIQETLSSDSEDKNILYIDSDVVMKSRPDEVFEYPLDVMATRMVLRNDRTYYKEINAGVSFWKANARTLRFCEQWLENDLLNRNPDIRYPEQRAFNDLVYRGYDGLADWSAGNVSENVYNYERDDVYEFIQGLDKYKPKLIHLKRSRWQDAMSMEAVKKYLREL